MSSLAFLAVVVLVGFTFCLLALLSRFGVLKDRRPRYKRTPQ